MRIGAQVRRVKVVSHGPRRHAKQLLEIGQGLLEKDQGLVVLQVADVLAEDGVTPFGEAERVLQLAAAGQQFGNRAAQVEGCGT